MWDTGHRAKNGVTPVQFQFTISNGWAWKKYKWSMDLSNYYIYIAIKWAIESRK